MKYTSFAPSRVTYVAGHLGLAVAAADAAMLERAWAQGAGGMSEARALAGGRQFAPDLPAQRDVEGVGGHFWYQGPLGV